MSSVEKEIDAIKILLASFFGGPSEAQRQKSIVCKAAENDSVKIYAGYSAEKLQEQLTYLQAQLSGMKYSCN